MTAVLSQYNKFQSKTDKRNRIEEYLCLLKSTFSHSEVQEISLNSESNQVDKKNISILVCIMMNDYLAHTFFLPKSLQSQ